MPVKVESDDDENSSSDHNTLQQGSNGCQHTKKISAGEGANYSRWGFCA